MGRSSGEKVDSGGSFGWSQQSPLMLPPSSNQDPWDEPPQNLVGYIPRVVRPASPGIPLTYSYGGGAPMSGVVYSKDAQKFRHEGADDDEFDDNAAADNYGLLERSASEKDWRNSAKPGYKKSASSEEFELPYELPSDIDAYSPRVDPFLPTPMDFRSKSLAGSELLKNPMPKGSKSLNCYKCGYACNSRIGVPVICNSPLEQCATFYDPQTLDVTARGCKINGEPGCFLTEDGVYGCTCKSQLCNDFKMYKVTGRIFNELFEPSSKGGKKRVDQETCDPCTKGCNKPCPPPVVPTPPGPETCCKAKANKKKPDKPGICCPPETKKRPTQCCYLDNLPKKYRVKYAHLIREAAGYSSANPVCQSSKSFLAAASAAAAAFGLLAFA
ncbi:unnamed protein product [Notodromas monacha]|uniref:4Fe-4S ferredoxin-type domain-containing protein n=1 Tax=Notodromas monacha TaxID=399045 RepID=A0A7R9BX78_9CRUS|nr:unnamed protein product [Notodromas monacha]CAG0923462.1 unnamed protein product [Notodromas monacha]